MHKHWHVNFMTILPYIIIIIIICLSDFVFLKHLEAPDCFTKLGGICVDNGHECPFENGIKKEYPKSSCKRMCPYKMFCCLPQENKDRLEYSKKLPSCGIQNYFSNKNPSHKIIRGHKAELKQFPWQVQIMCNPESLEKEQCGGTLIHPQWVLTAAHCRLMACNVSDYYLTMGKIYLNQREISKSLFNSSDGQVRRVEKAILHRKFNFKSPYNDIALIKLNKPIELNNEINTACLPNPNENFNNMVCIASGFGYPITNTSNSNDLLYFPLPIIPHEKCQKNVLKFTNYTLYKKIQYCAGFENGQKDTCRGDSGGPMVCLKKDKFGKNRHILAGFTVSGDAVCGESYGFPTLYTRVTGFLNWINKETGNLFV